MTLGRTRAEALSIAMNRLSNTNVTRYGFAVAGVVLGILLRLSLDRALGDHFPFATLFLAVLVVAGYAGRGPAFLTVGLGAVASARFLLPPRDSLEVRGFENQAGLVLYLVVGVGIALLGGALRNARIWAERNADQAVRQREQLRITLSSIGDAVLITDAEGRVTSLNPVAEALTGWPSSEAVGKPLPSIFHIINEETRREVENPALRTLNEGVIVGLANHTLLIDRNGTERPIDDSAGPIVDSAGRVVGAVLIFRDIGEKRKAEAELRRAGERARTILESITDGFCALDHDWRFTYVNRQAEVLLGRTSEDLLGKNHWDEYPAMIGTVFERDYRRAVAENLAVSFEEYYPPHDRWYEIHAYPSADGLSIYFQDISERVRANEALKAGEDRLRLALAAGRMGTWDWDISTGSLTWSDNLEEVHGLPPGGFDGTVDGFRRLVHPGDRDRVEAAIAHSIKEGTGYEAEFRFDRPDGTVGWMLGTGKVFADEAGRPARMIGLALDISERKRGEADLRVAQERLAAIIDHSPAIIFLKDREGRYLLINRRFEEFAIDLGIEGPYLGRCDADLLPREIAERFRSDDLEVMETRRVKIFEESVELGEVGRTGLTTKFPLLDERGEVYAVCGINLDISERKRAEERTHFQAHLLDTVGQAVIVNDPEGQITYWNRFAETLYGWRENEVTGCNIMDTVVPPEARATAAGIIGHLRTGANWSGEFTFRRKDSTTFPAFMTDTPIFDEHGTLKAIICISMDITERKRAEEELRERERFTQRILDASPGVVYVFDLEDRRTVFINERARGTIGLTPEAIEAKGGSFLAERVHPDDLPGVEAHLARISTLVDGDVLATEYRMRHADGRWLWFVSRDTVFQRSQDGKPRQVLGVASDITDQREAEKKLRESEERFRTMAESIPQLAWMARPDGHIYWYNKRWHEYTGTTPEQMEGWGWQSVHDPNMLPSVLERWESSIASGEPFDMVFPLKGADGNFRPFLTRVMPVWSEDGQVAHWFGTNTDIADRQRIEDELKIARDEAEKANQAKTQFLAVLSHELRTPLNPILLAASSMLDLPSKPEEIRPTLEMIRQNVNLQARLIDDLLDVMRIVRGKMPLHWEVADCHRLIHQAIQICRSEVFGGELRLEMDLAAGHRLVNADGARLQQVFWNLVKNAVKFTPEGGTILIRTLNEPSSDGSGEWIAIEVADTGIGIEPEVLPTIWDPFQQGETTITRKFGGLGLGLAICKGVVEAHGGTIAAKSEGKDQGTTFRVVLRALPEQVVEGNGEPVPGISNSAMEHPKSLRILVVEDEPATLRLMARLLRGLGYAVTTAATIASAYEAFDAGEFDLIVSDIGLPDGTGLDLMRRVIASRGQIPAIALTGYGMEDDIVRSREAGFTAHMTKPIDFTKLEAMIRQVAT